MFAHIQKRTVQGSVLWRLSIGGLPGAIIGVVVSARSAPFAQRSSARARAPHRRRRGIARLGGGHHLQSPPRRATLARGSNDLPTLRLALIGFFVGLTVSITSIGAGSLTLPLLLLAAPAVALRRLVGTDLAFAVVVLVPSLLGHWQIGDVNASIAGSLLAGFDSRRLRRIVLRDEAARALVPRRAGRRARRRRARVAADTASRERLAPRRRSRAISSAGAKEALERARVAPPSVENVVFELAVADVAVVARRRSRARRAPTA